LLRMNYVKTVIALILLAILIVPFVKPLEGSAASSNNLNAFLQNLNDASEALNQAQKYYDEVKDSDGNYSYEAQEKLTGYMEKGEAKLITALKSQYSYDPKYASKLDSLGAYKMTVRVHAANSGVDFVRRFETKIGKFYMEPTSAILQIKYSNGHVDVLNMSDNSLPKDSYGSPIIDLKTLIDKNFGFFQNNKKEILMLAYYENFRNGGWNIVLLNMSKNKGTEKLTQLMPAKDIPAELAKFADGKPKDYYTNICGQSSCTSTVENKLTLTKIDESGVAVTFGSKTIKLSNVAKNKTVNAPRERLAQLINKVTATGTLFNLKFNIGTPISDVKKLYGKPESEEGGTIFYPNFLIALDAWDKVSWLSMNAKANGLQYLKMADVQKLVGIQPRVENGLYTIDIPVNYEGSDYDQGPKSLQLTSKGLNAAILGVTLAPR
jgi:hypothetical protein